MQISAYKSPKTEELFLFIPQDKPLDDLPNELRVFFGEPKHVIDFELTAEKKLAREDANEVLKNIEQKGYFMQMPPKEKEKFSDITPPPAHLDNIF